MNKISEGVPTVYSINEMVRIAKLYYELGMTQQAIAKQENISRPTVSRILDQAMKEGVVQVTIKYPLTSVTDLEEKLQSLFGLQKVFVTPVLVSKQEQILSDVGQALSDYLSSQLKEGQTIGVSWGTSLTQVTKHLPVRPKKGVRVVQLNGGVSKKPFATNAMQILEEFAKAFSAQPYSLSVPTIVDSEEIAQAIRSDSHVREVLDMAEKADIAVFGIGRPSYQSVLYSAGYFQFEEYDQLIANGAVGDICSRYFTIDGSICDPALDARTISVSRSALQTVPHSIAIASGVQKVSAIIGALRGKWINTLFTDEQTARAVIQEVVDKK